ncbi:hypothetical protein [Teredinibacter sp. KSP-S5-2]|uniref:hypothetical protein n=1 Tax=Teredinibacter sp. KSP-S5-2 TaxID=3034506 RepID=UPI0029341CAE|nr:hypothetical protein [Teredinibacter sp. KSP-S5-2]WNO09522.1 hypothetical protein P5V12_21525 [Teredinibacter sp. KSP-S5-2]
MNLANMQTDFWELRSAEKCNTENPDSFFIPALEARKSLKVGDAAKLIFDIESQDEDGKVIVSGERMYVIVSEVVGDFYIGILDSQPATIEPNELFYLEFGVEVPFTSEHIIDITRPPEDYVEWQLSQDPEKIWDRG